MLLRRFTSVVLPLVVVWSVAGALGAEATTRPGVPDSFLRFVDDGHGGGSLQTADVGFVNAAGVRVHLIAAVHIGEKSYYEGLNRDFGKYDVVLYEMVKAKNAPVPKLGEGEESDNPISEFQRLLKDTLELDFQLDDIDYTAPNFVHADLDMETFEKMQAERGESFEEIMLRGLMRAITNPPPEKPGAVEDDSMDDLISVLTKPDMERQIKVVIARQLGQIDLSAMGLDGPDGSVLVTERNKKAMKTLSNEMAAGKKKIAIFYGAAHMTDMSKRLKAMGFSPVSRRWNISWDLTIRPDQPSAVEKLMQNLLDSASDDK
jgi:hypothetical protein